MRLADGWYWPDRETHMCQWMADPRNRVMLNGRPAYQGKKQIAALKLCESTAMRTALDVGAHIGTWAYNLAPVFRTVRCFEPVQEHRDCLTMNLVAENVYIMPVALGDRAGMVTMYTGPNSTGDTWVDPKVPGGSVQMMTLDSLEYDDVDFIKIDAEGFEEPILRGAAKTIRKCAPVICVEQKRDFPRKYGLQPQGAVAYLETLGYRVAQEIGGDYLMIPADD